MLSVTCVHCHLQPLERSQQWVKARRRVTTGENLFIFIVELGPGTDGMDEWLDQNQTLLWKQNCSKCNKIHRVKIMFCCVCKIFRKRIWWWQMVKVAALWDIAKYCQSFYVATVLLESGHDKRPDNVYCNQSSWLKNFPSALIWSILRWLFYNQTEDKQNMSACGMLVNKCIHLLLHVAASFTSRLLPQW